MASFPEFSRSDKGLIRFCRRPLVRQIGIWCMLLSTLPVLSSGCNYYRTQAPPPAAAGLSQLADHKFFLVHEGAQVWQLTNPRLESEVLVGTRTAVTANLGPYLNPDPQATSRRYRHRDAQTALNLVHLYVAGSEAEANGAVCIPVSSMQRLDIVEQDTGRTIVSHVLVGLRVTAAALVLVSIIAILTKSSCPFVCVHDGRQYQFVGEAYSGAVFAPAERDDYMPLPTIEPVDGEYQVKISNKLKEREYTNLAEL